MTDTAIYNDIAKRTGGDVYIGVVGPVRTGKSTLIKQFTQKMLLPMMDGDFARERARDEMPQSASGRTVMTTEPKFIPEQAVEVSLSNNSKVKLKLIDCVGYVVDGAMGLMEDGRPRMVMTPWADEPMPFAKAAEIGTRKVISDHATIGILVTTDGSITDLPRENYIKSEERVANELSSIGKPYVIVINSVHPNSKETVALANELNDKYGVRVLPLNCIELQEDDLSKILQTVLYEFPVREIRVAMPEWINTLDKDNEIKNTVSNALIGCISSLKNMGEVSTKIGEYEGNGLSNAELLNMDLGTGRADIEIKVPQSVFYQTVSKLSGFEVSDDKSLMSLMIDLSAVKSKYDRIESALNEVNETGYGIVVPDESQLSLEEPEIVKQSGGYGVRLKASAPSIHMIKANIETEVSPIVGTEKQSEAMIEFLLKEFEEDPKKIWESDMFGKSLHELVTEGLTNKLGKMPSDARKKMSETLQRIINEGSGGLICILL